MKKVSIIIPVYNRTHLLKQAIDSIRKQTNCEFELIVVDDGSDKEERDSNKRLTEAANGIWVEIDHCGIASHVRNVGIKKAQYDWVAFLDSDDVWLPTKLERQIAKLDLFTSIPISLSPCDIEEFLTKEGVCKKRFLVHTKEEWNREGVIVSQSGQRHPHSGDIFEAALQKCIIGPSTVLMNKKIFLLLGGFNENLEIAEDYELWLRFTTLFCVDYIDEALIIKRAGRWQQLSSKYDHIEDCRIRALGHYIEWAKTLLVNTSEVNQPNLFKRLNECKSKAINMLKKKIEIYSIGALKRGKSEELFALKKEFSHYLE